MERTFKKYIAVTLLNQSFPFQSGSISDFVSGYLCVGRITYFTLWEKIAFGNCVSTQCDPYFLTCALRELNIYYL